MQNKRVLIRIDAPIYEEKTFGGAEKVVNHLIYVLSSNGFQVHVLCPSGDKPAPTTQNPKYHTFDFGSGSSSVGQLLNSLRGIRLCREVFSKYNFDIALDNVSHIPYYPLHILASKNVILLHSCQMKDSHRFSPQLQAYGIEFIERTLPYLNNPHFICTSHSTKQRIRDHLNYNRTDVINPAIDIKKYHYNFSPDSDFVLSLGRLGPRKNIDCLLRAWEKINEKDHTLMVCGSGPEETKLKKVVADLNIDNVVFKGHVSETEKIRLLSSAKLFVFTTHHEGFGITGLEAMASGTPVIGANTWGLQDYIKDGKSGLLYARSDPDDLSQKLRYAFENVNRMKQIAEQGRLVARKYSLNEFRHNAITTFNNIIG